MADTKVSELTAATSLGGGDSFYVVQNNQSKKVTASVLFANAANVILNDTIQLDATVQLLSSPGIVDTNVPVTHLVADATGGALVLPTGSTNQLKIIVLKQTAGGTYTIAANVANSANIIFDSVGDTATLLYTDTAWYLIGGTASVT